MAKKKVSKKKVVKKVTKKVVKPKTFTSCAQRERWEKENE